MNTTDPTSITVEQLARCIDHTLLKPEATPDQIDKLCEEAIEHSFATVCVNPVHVRRAREILDKHQQGTPTDKSVQVCTVAGFPLGANTTNIKATEAQRALDDGAREIDMVVNIGALIAGDRDVVHQDIQALARIVHGRSPAGVLKVILETAALTTEQIILGCRLCAEGEADFVKTSTGFHSGGGATVEAVRLLHRHAAPIRVKASGGIRTLAAAREMIAAGASRLGSSSGAAILAEARNGN